MKNTAYVKYLRQLPLELRARVLLEHFISGGELAFELAEELDEYNPIKLAERLDTYGEDLPVHIEE